MSNNIRNKINLNTLSHLAIVELIERVLSKGINITTVKMAILFSIALDRYCGRARLTGEISFV